MLYASFVFFLAVLNLFVLNGNIITGITGVVFAPCAFALAYTGYEAAWIIHFIHHVSRAYLTI